MGGTGTTALLAGLLIAAAADRSDAAGFYDPAQNHEKIIAEAIDAAADQRKRVLVEVGAEECPWVRRLDALFVRDKEIAATLEQGFVLLRFSIHGADRSKWVRSHLPELNATPSLFVLDEDGRLLFTQDTTPLESGAGYDRGRVMAFLGKWATPDRTAEAVAQTSSLMPEVADIASPKIAAAELPVVVYYYSPKSRDGRELTTTLENISVDYSDKAAFFTIDADKAKTASVPGRKPAAIPRLVLMKGGKRRTVPLPEEGRDEDKVRALLDSWLAR